MVQYNYTIIWKFHMLFPSESICNVFTNFFILPRISSTDYKHLNTQDSCTYPPENELRIKHTIQPIPYFH